MKPTKVYRMFSKIRDMAKDYDFVFTFVMLDSKHFYITGMYKNGEEWLTNLSCPIPNFKHINRVRNFVDSIVNHRTMKVSYKTISNEIVITNQTLSDKFCK